VQTLNGIDNKFRMAILVARRAKQLIGGARRKIEFKSDNPLTVALEEFKQGKIDFNVLNEEPDLFGTGAQNLEGIVEAGEAGLDSKKTEADLSSEDPEEVEAEPEPDSKS
jgi:DNA-directed RNA polymerase subunit omega